MDRFRPGLNLSVQELDDGVGQQVDRLYSTPADLGEIRFVDAPYTPHPDMSDDYLC